MKRVALKSRSSLRTHSKWTAKPKLSAKTAGINGLKPKLPKKKSRSKLKKELWKIVSDYIRRKENWTCFTCGRVAQGSGMHAGHFIPKSLGSALYFEENNIHAQCYRCNIDLDGYGPMYYQRMLQKYGQQEIDRLMGLKASVVQLDYDALIPLWKEKLCTLDCGSL